MSGTNELIDLYPICDEPSTRISIQSPWYADGFACATNARILVWAFPSFVAPFVECGPNPPKLSGVVTDQHRTAKESEFAPVTPVVVPDPYCPGCNQTGEFIKTCENCHGSGQCECRCDHCHECGWCEGSGNQTEYCGCYVNIHGRRIALLQLSRMAKLPGPLKFWRPAEDNPKEDTPVLFSFANGIGRGLVMPLCSKDD